MLLYLQIIQVGFEQTALEYLKINQLHIGALSRYLIGSKKRIDFEAAHKLVLVEARHPGAGGRHRGHPDAFALVRFQYLHNHITGILKGICKFPPASCIMPAEASCAWQTRLTGLITAAVSPCTGSPLLTPGIGDGHWCLRCCHKYLYTLLYLSPHH